MTTEYELPVSGFVRLKQFVGPGKALPISRSTWWAGVKDGRFPKPMKLGKRVTVWRAEDIHRLIEQGVPGDGA
jgi:prophage regulatory protein